MLTSKNNSSVAIVVNVISANHIESGNVTVRVETSSPSYKEQLGKSSCEYEKICFIKFTHTHILYIY